MRFDPNIFGLSILCASMALQQPASAQEEPATPPQQDRNPVVAKVGDQEIRAQDLFAEINRQIPLVSYHRNVSPAKMREIRCDSLDILIDRSLIHQDALRREIPVSDEEIREQLRAALAKTEDFQEASDEQVDAMVVQYRPLIERRILRDKNEARFESGLPKVKEEDVRSIYDRLCASNDDSVLTPPEARIHQIFLAVDPSSSNEVIAEKEALAQAAHAALVAGKPFAEVAKEFSEGDDADEGGDMGLVRKADIRSATLREATFRLQTGELSELIRSLYGFHIVRCDEMIPRRQISFEDMLPQLEDWWSTAHRKQARDTWLAELRGQYQVWISPEEEALREEQRAAEEEARKRGAAEGGHGTAPAHGH